MRYYNGFVYTMLVRLPLRMIECCASVVWRYRLECTEEDVFCISLFSIISSRDNLTSDL